MNGGRNNEKFRKKYLDFNGQEIEFNVLEESTFTSKHTGAQLQKVKAEFTVLGEEEHERLNESIMKIRAKNNILKSTGNVQKTWKIKNEVISYLGGGVPNTDYHYTLDLEEAEGHAR